MKLEDVVGSGRILAPPPAWGRELKPLPAARIKLARRAAPCVGA